jgi:integrase/recombinase XerC
MNELAEKYLSTLDRSANTIKTYRQALSYYFDVVDSIDNESYEKFLLSIKENSHSTKTIRKTAVMGMFDFLEIPGSEKRRRLNKHYIARQKRKDINVSEESIKKVVDYCEKLTGGLAELRDRAFVLMMADGGFRISEICSLKRGDVDWKNQRVPVVGKGSKFALVRLSNRATDALRLYLEQRQAMDGASGKPLNTMPLWARHGKTDKTAKMTIDGMRKAIKQRIEDAGVDPKTIRVHDFRHYFVTVTLRASNIKTAKEFARHESIEVTDRYSHLSEDELDKTYYDIFNRKETD